MSTSARYIVKFGVDAWTIQYEDVASHCIVTFEVDVESFESRAGPQAVILDADVLCDGKWAEMNHSELVLGRVQKHLEEVGYVVKRSGA